MQFTPSEVELLGVYFPPLLSASLLGAIAAAATAIALNRYRLLRFFYYPPAVYLALAIVYTGLIGTFVIPV